jgi:charged multivesicular body protein 7
MNPQMCHLNKSSLPIGIFFPATVCTGRTEAEFEEFGTGTGLHIVTGADATVDYVSPALQETGMEGTEWNYGGCFPSMGRLIY